jgi:deoxyribodipyrimidine photo-lyase
MSRLLDSLELDALYRVVCIMQSVSVVWFKRDLRLRDHEALYQAYASNRPVVLLYCLEPEFLDDPHTAPRHVRFVAQSLAGIRAELAQFGHRLWEWSGSVEGALDALRVAGWHPHLYSHEETGLGITYQRDKRVKKWCTAHAVEWYEFPTNGVVRGLAHRGSWDASWKRRMEHPPVGVDLANLLSLPDGVLIPGFGEGMLEEFSQKFPVEAFAESRQPGGEAAGWAYLHSFVNGRLADYRKSISKPEAARRGCSRLSPYLAWGNLTIRQVMHALAEADPPWRKDIQFFVSRLHWHCHFIQKFESECRIEFENLNRGFDGIRSEIRADWVAAWSSGQTGFPMVDAAMRSVCATGYLNFRMRSLLVSFLTHHLWQPWQAGVVHLARQFLDFEPGIHYAQFQMQAGTMGVNTLRIYNPVKQAEDNDPEGLFLRKWLPELAALPLPLLREPWKMTEMESLSYGVRLGTDYPHRILDHEDAARHAREHLWGTKRSPEARSEVPAILAKHVRSAGKNPKRRGG